nr:MAG TPA: hypothetical protein [Caudoviricetes sp.]
MWKTPRKCKTPELVMVLVSCWLKIWRVNRGENASIAIPISI